jgi:MoxR-like ATPase
MTNLKPYELYAGDGATLLERGLTMPHIERDSDLHSPARYVAGKELSDAVNVALMLGQPLLVAGEPGTGKTQLAWSIAYELFQNTPLVFNTKTTSAARDLFYSYDALRHFRDANLKSADVSLEPEDYITYEALGLAILLSLPSEERPTPVSRDARRESERNGQVGAAPQRSVVLIDEIDKAPRDFPNDILHEIEELSFTVKETGRTFKVNDDFRPIIVLTSNSERNLPDAFLRRCVFYDIPFPGAERLMEIVRGRLSLSPTFRENVMQEAIKHFEEIRALPLKKKPATAELIAWVKVLDRMQIDIKNLQAEQADALALTYSVLAKNRDDIAIIKEAFTK